MAKRITFPILLLGLALTLAGLTTSAFPDVLKIGIADEYAPLSDNMTGQPEGYLVDLISRLEPHLNSEVELVSSDWTSLEAALKSGEIDTLFGLYFTEARAEEFSFGPEIFRNRVHFYFRDDANILSIEDAFGKKVAVAGETSYLRTFADTQFPEIEWVVLPDLPRVLEAMKDDSSIVGIFEEETLVGHSLQQAGFSTLVQTGPPQLERSLRPVSLRERSVVVQEVSEALSKITNAEITRLRVTWLKGSRQFATSRAVALTESEKDFLEKYPMIPYAGDPNWAPISSLAADGEYQGIQHDILQLIQERTGLSISKKPYTDRIATRTAVEQGQALLRGGDDEEPDSTIGYFTLPLSLVTRSSGKRSYSLSAYSGARITIEASSPHLSRFAQRYPGIEFVPVAIEQEGLERVANSLAQAHIGNYATCSYLVQRYYVSSLHIIDTLSEKQTLSFVLADFPDAPILMSILNKGIASISEEEANAIYDDWVQANVKQVTDFSKSWKPIAAVAFCLLLAVLWRVSTLKLKKAQAEARERLLLAKEAGAGGQFEWYPKSGNVTYSPEFFEMLGYSPGDLDHSESTVTKLTHPDDLRRSYPRQLICTRAGREYEHKMRMRRVDGSWAWIILRGIPTHFHKDGSVKRYIGVQLDVTALQVAIEKLRKQQAIAKKASKAKSEFLANMSHEIRTPMNAILGFTRLLKRDQTLTARQAEYVQLVNSSSEHLLGILDAILDMSKIESGHVSLLQLKVDLPKLLEDIAAIFKARCDDRGIVFESSFSEDLPKYILADSTKLRQIIFNLMVNAVKFTNDGQISLKASLQDDQLHIAVEDTGCGITEKELSTLFTAFSQGEAGKKQSRGTGLGLTISREFCKLMGGDISVKSVDGEGSTFTVKLPFEETTANPQDDEVTNIHIPYRAAASQSLLVVDDKLSNLQYMERFLGEYGFNIRLAQDGETALALWKLYTPDLILLDIRMPKVDGYEVVQRIREDSVFHQPKILALTASAFDQQRQRILDLGADHFMTKPFNENTLLRAIADLLELPTTLQAAQPTDKISLPPFTQPIHIELTAKQSRELVEACNGGYLEKIDRVISEFENTQPKAAEELRALARNFEYERISIIASQATSHSLQS